VPPGTGSGEDGEQPQQGKPEEAELDESLEESFPSSDPPSTWAGSDDDE
jgi:hypothetical protein